MYPTSTPKSYICQMYTECALTEIGDIDHTQKIYLIIN